MFIYAKRRPSFLLKLILVIIIIYKNAFFIKTKRPLKCTFESWTDADQSTGGGGGLKIRK